MESMLATVFDFDGVIADTEAERFIALQRIFGYVGFRLPDNMFHDTLGKPTKTILEKYFGNEIPPKVRDQILQCYQVEFKSKVALLAKPIPATVDTLLTFRPSQRLAIASMSTPHEINQILTNFGIRNRFAHIISRDDVTRNKPDPEVYLAAAAKLGLRPEKCNAIEDTPIGIEAAIAAEMHCYGFVNAYNREEDLRDAKVGSKGISGILKTAGDIKRVLS